MKKIGIVTYWKSNSNYGQILQNYALQYFLKAMGHSPFLIKYNSSVKNSVKRKLIHLFFLLLPPSKLFKSIFNRTKKVSIDNDSNDRGFENFKKNHISSTDIEYDINKLESNPPLADFYFCGSDQVWNCYNDGYFLQWGSKSIPKIAYAVSFGKTQISNEFKYYLRKALKTFKVVAVREKSGLKICEESGRNDVIWRPDPTLLLNKNDYRKLTTTLKKPEKDYILLYMVGNKSSVDTAQIKNLAEKENLDIIYVPSMSREDSLPKTFPTINEWIHLFDHCKYVLTNSFHGTIFSIVFEKKFVVYNLSGVYSHMNTRIDSLLTELELKNRMYKDNLNFIDSNINYNKITNYISNNSKKIKSEFSEWLS